jgi:transcriptional regulator with XRE-family HTH domain
MEQHREEVRDFLTSRRERLTPDQAGLPLYGTNRRVKGLRRDEVAVLSGISTDYYTRLERGNLNGVSDQVLEALATALQLDEAERTHLFDLAHVANSKPNTASSGSPTRVARRQGLRPGVRLILDGISAPAYVRNTRMDILALNQLGRALFADALGEQPDPSSGLNLARYLFLDDRSRDFYREWPTVARDSVAALRIEAGRNPYDRGLTDLVGELSTRSVAFRTWWAAHNVKLHRTATKHLHHSVVGDLELTGEALTLPGDPGLTIITYTVEPASPSAQALDFLASWSRTSKPADTTQAAEASTD